MRTLNQSVMPLNERPVPQLQRGVREGSGGGRGQEEGGVRQMIKVLEPPPPAQDVAEEDAEPMRMRGRCPNCKEGEGG